MLSASDIDKYRQLLLTRQREVDDLIEELSDRCEPVEPDPSIGPLTRNDAMQDQQMALYQRRQLVLQKTRIATALGRMDKGEFGVCPACKNPIDPKRLELVPESPMCVACLEKHRAAPGGRRC